MELSTVSTPDITFMCLSCGKHLTIEGAGAGLEVNCPDCNATVKVPSIATESRSGDGTTDEDTSIRDGVIGAFVSVATVALALYCAGRFFLRDGAALGSLFLAGPTLAGVLGGWIGYSYGIGRVLVMDAVLFGAVMMYGGRVARVALGPENPVTPAPSVTQHASATPQPLTNTPTSASQSGIASSNQVQQQAEMRLQQQAVQEDLIARGVRKCPPDSDAATAILKEASDKVVQKEISDREIIQARYVDSKLVYIPTPNVEIVDAVAQVIYEEAYHDVHGYVRHGVLTLVWDHSYRKPGWTRRGGKASFPSTGRP